MIYADEITVNYIKSLQNYINESKDINYIPKTINKDNLFVLNTVLNRIKDIQKTCQLEYFNGEYDITEENLEYYLKEMAIKYDFKIKDDKFHEIYYVVEYLGHEIQVGFNTGELIKRIDGVNSDFLSVHIDKKIVDLLFSFYQLDKLFYNLKHYNRYIPNRSIINI